MGHPKAALAFGALILAFLAENKRSNEKLGKEHYIISSAKIGKAFDGKKIVFLSDLHNIQLGKNNKTLLDMIDSEKPDYILVGGDMLVSKAANHSGHALALMKELSAKYPVYYANGNHEERLLWKSGECPEAGHIYKGYMARLKKMGVRHLYNDTVTIEEGGCRLFISGLSLDQSCYGKFDFNPLPGSYIEERLGSRGKGGFHILLAHNPLYFEAYAKWGADLTLSGHLHGGIVRLPRLGGVIAPSYQLFPKYDAGLFRIGKKRMIVSVGLGSHSIRLRLFNPPRIDVITLKREEGGVRL